MVFTFCLLIVQWVAQAQTAVLSQIQQRIDNSDNPRETLVQWYYAVQDLDRRVREANPQHPGISNLTAISQSLRTQIENNKKSLWSLEYGELLTTYRPLVQTADKPLDTLCRQRYQLVDDRSYALDLPTPLVLATLDMESSCRRSNPTNGDGVFQLIAKDYGTGSTLSVGQWIMMMYDYGELVRGKHVWYNNINGLSTNNCNTKNINLTGQTAPICLSYTTIDIDSIIKYGALYNGLARNAERQSYIRWDIQPANPNYVYGKLWTEFVWANKDGLIVRILKVLQFVKTL